MANQLITDSCTIPNEVEPRIFWHAWNFTSLTYAQVLTQPNPNAAIYSANNSTYTVPVGKKFIITTVDLGFRLATASRSVVVRFKRGATVLYPIYYTTQTGENNVNRTNSAKNGGVLVLRAGDTLELDYLSDTTALNAFATIVITGLEMKA